MEKPLRLYEVLYLSKIAADAPIKVVGEIAGISRKNNEALEITGLLVFDGSRFCQHLEGPQKKVLSLMERIQDDPRHTDVEVVHHGMLADRRFRNFSLAYAPVEDVDILEALEKLDGQAAMQHFMTLVEGLDPQA